MLDRVTLTGADDSVFDPNDLIQISRDYPFVEWGILLSSSRSGRVRYPSINWLTLLWETVQASEFKPKIAFHVCGSWVREICAGNWTSLMSNRGFHLVIGQRIQLNFHGYGHQPGPLFHKELKRRSEVNRWSFIFQIDGENEGLVESARDFGIDAVPLFDKSSGAGVTPDEWPEKMDQVYCGYAGGIGPDNIASEIMRVEKSRGFAKDQPYWIDMETKLYTDDRFDLNKCIECLDVAIDFV
jgi:hypothetical protein